MAALGHKVRLIWPTISKPSSEAIRMLRTRRPSAKWLTKKHALGPASGCSHCAEDPRPFEANVRDHGTKSRHE